MRYFYSFILLYSLSGVLFSCTKDKESSVTQPTRTLPAITYTGLQTGGSFFQGELITYNSSYNNSFELAGGSLNYFFHQTGDKFTLANTFHIDNFTGVGTYRVPEDCRITLQRTYAPYNTSSTSESMDSQSAKHLSGYINFIYVDTVKRITAAVYELKFVDTAFATGDTISIEQGRFDFKY